MKSNPLILPDATASAVLKQVVDAAKADGHQKIVAGRASATREEVIEWTLGVFGRWLNEMKWEFAARALRLLIELEYDGRLPWTMCESLFLGAVRREVTRLAFNGAVVRIDDEGEPVSIEEFIEVNEHLDPQDVRALARLSVGSTWTIGGGAAAEALIRMVSLGDEEGKGTS